MVEMIIDVLIVAGALACAGLLMKKDAISSICIHKCNRYIINCFTPKGIV